MNDTAYVVILEWMLELNLSIVERTIYAIIYGFSQKNMGKFTGSRAYLANWCSCTTRTVDTALAKLVSAGLLNKKEHFEGGVKLCSYTALKPQGKNFAGSEKISQGVAKKLQGGSENISHNIIDNNAENKFSANRGYIERADARTRTRETSKSFDFPGALVALGVDRTTAEDWAACRKSKGARNSESEFNFVAQEIRAVCARDGVTPQQCVAFAAGNTWRGFKASWEETKQIKKNGSTKYDPVTGRKIYTGDTI